ncbi:hypothetical protein ACROYT_G016724 [Oculina patagonica]
MTMLYLFLSLFASQLFFATPSVIREEQAEDGEEQETPDPDAHATKTKREIQPKKPEQEDYGCQKVDLIVHTKDLGLSTKSIWPESFNAYRCKGKCSLTPKKKFINHSLLKAFLKKKKGIKTDGEACCVPTKLRPMSFVYDIKGRGSFVLHTFQDMIVEECGCY